MREALAGGDKIAGPAIISEPNQTTVVEAGWQAELTGQDNIVLRRVEARPERRAIGTQADPVMLEVFNNLFMSIAEQMGYPAEHRVLGEHQGTPGLLLRDLRRPGPPDCQRAHMPVHLGSMGESVRTVMNANRGRMMPGDAYVVNDPYHGGTHLPDVTVITPVFDRGGKKSCSTSALAATTPTSAGPRRARCRRIRGRSRTKACCSPISMVKNGELREQAARDILGSGRWPARNPDQNIADMRAQIAANERACRNCCACAITSAWTWCVPTWGTCRTTPRKRCAA